MKQEPVRSIDRDDPPQRSGRGDPVLNHMVRRGLPLTREVYLELAFPDGAPDPMPPELEGELPEEFQRHDG